MYLNKEPGVNEPSSIINEQFLSILNIKTSCFESFIGLNLSKDTIKPYAFEFTYSINYAG
jgi:hypothetical protein